MNRQTYVRASDGAPVTEDEALDERGVLRSGYKTWISLPLWQKDSATGPSSRMFLHDSQEKVTLSDSDLAYYRMVEYDQNAWRNPSGQTTTQQADSVQPVVLSDSETAWKAMVEFDQNAWKLAHKGSR